MVYFSYQAHTCVYDMLPSPYLVVCGLVDTMSFTYQRLYFVSLILNNSDIRGEDTGLKNFNSK